MDIETANRLLQYRKKHNLSQEDLANKIGVSRQAVSKWELAEASPDTDNLILLAEIYGVSLDELLKGESNNSSKSEAEQETVSEESAGNTQIPTGDEGTEYIKADKVSLKTESMLMRKTATRYTSALQTEYMYKTKTALRLI